eukprot:4192908-Ditylum_brightwellii.AAC.1
MSKAKGTLYPETPSEVKGTSYARGSFDKAGFEMCDAWCALSLIGTETFVPEPSEQTVVVQRFLYLSTACT